MLLRSKGSQGLLAYELVRLNIQVLKLTNIPNAEAPVNQKISVKRDDQYAQEEKKAEHLQIEEHNQEVKLK
jgi:hypothetical protein